jgi:hypothetical protein
MGEFLFELLLAFGELFLVVLFEFAGEGLLDLALRAIAKVFDTPLFTNPELASAGYTSSSNDTMLVPSPSALLD